MPIPFIPVAVSSVALVVGGAGLLKWKTARDIAAGKAATRDECERQRIALEQAVQAGHPPAEIQQIRINLAACVRRAGNEGVDIGDTAALGLLPCSLQREYIERVMTDYRATNYADPVARDSKRGAMLSAGAEMVGCLRGQLEAAATPDAVRTVLAEIMKASNESRARAVCYFDGAGGCGRFAENEQGGNERGMVELERIGVPLGQPWNDGYGPIGFGERFRAASGMQDRTRELVAGEYGGLRLIAEQKLATFRPQLAPAATMRLVTPRVPLGGLRITLAG